MQKRLYEMEVRPPEAVWEKLSVTIDEINEDNLLAKKVLNAELSPPAGTWEKINSTINVFEEIPASKKTRVINLRRLAIAAIFVGLIATAWILLRNNNSTGLAEVERSQQKNSTDTGATIKIENPNLIDSPVDPSNSGITGIARSGEERPGTAVTYNQRSLRTKKNNILRNRNSQVAQPAMAQYASLTKPLEKSFKEPIDDLSLVTSDQNYLTMVNANGRLVKIPAQLASLAPHLQDKPISEDYYEVLFGEGAYWKETLNEWRMKVVSTPVSAGDAFTSFVELLKNVQNR
jgi:hypothetical protein